MNALLQASRGEIEAARAAIERASIAAKTLDPFERDDEQHDKPERGRFTLYGNEVPE